MTLEKILNPEPEPEAAQPSTEAGTKRLIVADVFQQMTIMRNAFERMAKHFGDIPEEKPMDLDTSLNEIIRDSKLIEKACLRLLGGNR